MTLSAILACQERIKSLRSQTAYLDAWQLFRAQTNAAIDHHVLRYAPAAKQVSADLEAIDRDLATLHSRWDRYILDLEQQRQSLEPQYHLKSRQIYDEELIRAVKAIDDPGMRIEDFWNTQTTAGAEDIEVIRARLDAFNDWRVPGVIIRPGTEDWINSMVALDPLYLVDTHSQLLRPAVSRYPRLYQQRLRQYISDESKCSFLSNLPQRQIGVVFCHGFFQTRPLEVIRRYLEEIWQILRDGGILMMTYTDGDRSRGVELVEQSVNCYTPGHALRSIWREIGYQAVFEYHMDLGWSYAELRRPGEMKTLRGGQSLAKIRPIR